MPETSLQLPDLLVAQGTETTIVPSTPTQPQNGIELSSGGEFVIAGALIAFTGVLAVVSHRMSQYKKGRA